MKMINSDKELNRMMKEITLESPGSDFSSKVMESILPYAETYPKAEPLLGRKFWILVSLFVLLALLFILFSGNMPSSGKNGMMEQFLPDLPKIDWSHFRNLFSAFLEKSTSLGWTLGSLMGGALILLLADQLFASSLFGKNEISNTLQ